MQTFEVSALSDLELTAEEANARDAANLQIKDLSFKFDKQLVPIRAKFDIAIDDFHFGLIFGLGPHGGMSFDWEAVIRAVNSCKPHYVLFGKDADAYDQNLIKIPSTGPIYFNVETSGFRLILALPRAKSLTMFCELKTRLANFEALRFVEQQSDA
jgi:hypothetical protein